MINSHWGIFHPPTPPSLMRGTKHDTLEVVVMSVCGVGLWCQWLYPSFSFFSILYFRWHITRMTNYSIMIITQRTNQQIFVNVYATFNAHHFGIILARFIHSHFPAYQLDTTLQYFGSDNIMNSFSGGGGLSTATKSISLRKNWQNGHNFL